MGTLAIAFIRVECAGTYRRYNNDDNARRFNNTFTRVTWARIMQEWKNTAAAYAVVQSGSILARTQQATAAIARENSRKRRKELIEQGMNRSERLRVTRQENRDNTDTAWANRERIEISEDSEDENVGAPANNAGTTAQNTINNCVLGHGDSASTGHR